MNRLPAQSLANAYALFSALIGVPSLTVLLLYAIQELRATNPTSPVRSISETNADAITAAINFLTESFGNYIVLYAVFGLIIAGLLWFFGRALQLRAVRATDPHPCLSVSIRG